MGKFSSDRTFKEYAKEILDVSPVPVTPPALWPPARHPNG